MKTKKSQIPNFLTTLRLILVIPFIVFLILFQKFGAPYNDGYQNSWIWSLMVAMVIFIIAMITDFLDGYIARKTNSVSMFGKLFDPIGDKIITSTALIFLAFFGYTEIWIVVIFILRDIIVDGCRNLAAAKKIEVSASIWGKLKTLIQSIAIPLLFVLGPIANETWIFWLINIPLIIATLLSVFSGYLYVMRIVPVLREKK